MTVSLWPRLFISKGVVKVNFSITNLCNYRCVHCNIWEKYLLNPQYVLQEMSSENFLKILQNTNSVKWVSITGGEHFLKKGLDYLLLNLPLHIKLVSINTNGSLPRKVSWIMDSVTNKFHDKVFYVSISLDGPPDIHDKIRGVEGAFENAIRTYSLLRGIAERGGNLNVNFEYTINPWNIGGFQKLMQYFSENDIPITEKDFVISLYEVSQYYNNNTNHEYPNFESAASKILKELNVILKQFPVITTRPSSIFTGAFLALAKQYYTREKVHKCLAGEKSAWVDAFGNVRMCIYQPSVLGNVADYNFNLNALISQKSDAIRITKKTCSGCWTPRESYTTMIFKPRLLAQGVVRLWAKKVLD